MHRRDFLKTLAATAAARGALPLPLAEPEAPLPEEPKEPKEPWRAKGFNLLEKFQARNQRPFVERDFEWMARWGFGFARLPMDYRSWTDAGDPHRLDESVLADIDRAVEWGERHGVHINLNLHRAPGYCVNPPAERLDLWSSSEARELFCLQWRHFAARYKGTPPRRLSFDLLNEPGAIEEESYADVMGEAVAVIREVDPERPIIIDGLRWGREPVLSLAGLGVAQSTRGYDPMELSHYRASWVRGSERWAAPSWPLVRGDRRWDRERYARERVAPWRELESKGVSVHVGEWGAYNKTPHAVVLAWMRDLLALWRESGWGWALWNLRGAFGVADSERENVEYESFENHRLDRKMLELLRSDGED